MKKTFLLKTMLLLCAFIVGVANSVWGEDQTLTITQSALGLTGSYSTNTEKTIDGITFVHTDLMKNNSNIQVKASTGVIYNKTAFPTNIKSVAITHSGTARSTTILGSSDGTNWTQVATGSGSITGNFTNKGYKYLKITRGSNAAYWTQVVITYEEAAAAGTTATPTISGNTSFLDNTTVTITNDASADGADIFYTLNGDDPTTTASATCFAYSAPFQVSTTTTVKAIAKKSTDTNASSVVNKTFTKITPKTVAEARAAIDAGEGITGVYVAGIVCEGGASLSSGALNYWISDDGTETDKFEIYKGKGLNGTNFTSVNDVKVGDVVVVYGDIKKYNTIYEFDSGSRLVIHKQKVLNPTVSPAAGAVAAGTMVTISTATEGATIYYTTDGTAPTTESSVYSAPITINAATTIKAIAIKNGFPSSDVIEAAYTIAVPVATPTFSLAEGTYTSVQTVTITTDTEDASIYYTTNGSEPTTSSQLFTEPISVGETMTIKAIAVKGGMANSAVASATYTINLPDYAELPFSYNNGRSDIESIIGLTQTGLGTDYSSSPKLKFDTTGDNLVLKINEIPGLLSFDIKGNTFSGGTFKVQTSVDGVNYSDLNTYSSLGDTQSEKFDLSADIRYIKWIYTSKSTGNVGIGNIVLTNTKEITISSAGWATYCSSAPLDFTDVTALTAYTATVDGNAVKFNKVTGKVPANTGLLVSGETANVPVCSSADPVANILEGVTAETPKAANSIFVLKNGTYGLGFYKNANPFTLRAHSAYIPVENIGATARGFISLEDEATGIKGSLTPTLSEGEGAWYDLSGRRVAKPTKGVYIVNGKKIIK